MGFRNPPISISELTITVGIACACLHTGFLCECWDCELGSHAFEANTFQDWITFPVLRCLATEVWSACSGSAVMNLAKAETKLTVVRSDTLHVSQAIKGAVTDGSHGVPQPCLNMLSWGRTPCPLSASQSPQPQSAHETSIRRTPNETLHKTSDQCSSKSAETREVWLPWQQERKETQTQNLLQHPEWGPGTGKKHRAGNWSNALAFVLVRFVLSARHKQSSGEMDPQRRTCLHHINMGHCLNCQLMWEGQLTVDGITLGRWAWAVWEVAKQVRGNVQKAAFLTVSLQPPASAALHMDYISKTWKPSSSQCAFGHSVTTATTATKTKLGQP